MIIESKFELFVTDPDKSAEFYATLGIPVVDRKSSGYITLRSGPTVIALSPIPWWLPVGWLGFLRSPPIGTEIVLYTAQLERSRTALSKAGYSPGQIALQAWGDRDFRITDPGGYYVRVSEGIAVPDTSRSMPNGTTNSDIE
jgi:catechol 2,3-dioxygenase-like lactoylglutathione lyase family enzyme